MTMTNEAAIGWLSRAQKRWIEAEDVSGRAAVLAFLLEFRMETGIEL